MSTPLFGEGLSLGSIVAEAGRSVSPGVRFDVVVDPSSPARSKAVVVASKLVVDATAARLVRALEWNGIPSVLLRGPAVARWLYDDDLARSYADVDLLVPDDRFPEARRVLEGLGFTESPLESRFPLGRPAHAETWIRRGDSACVDLHRSLIGVGAAAALVWHTISSEAEPMIVVGEEIRVPRPGARALLVALHAAQHGTTWGQPLEDLSRALERVPPETWGRAAALAEELDATAALAAGLHLLPAGESLATTLGLPRGRPVNDLRGSDSFHVAQGIEWMLEQAGLSRKIAFLARKAAPPPATMRLRSSLARRGSLGLGLAYVWRAVRLCWYGLVVLPSLARMRRPSRGARNEARRTRDHSA